VANACVDIGRANLGAGLKKGLKEGEQN